MQYPVTTAVVPPDRYATPAMRARLLRETGAWCKGCNVSVFRRPWEADHIVPWSVCRETRYENLQVLCVPCNQVKGASRDSDFKWLLRTNGVRWRDREYRKLSQYRRQPPTEVEKAMWTLLMVVELFLYATGRPWLALPLFLVVMAVRVAVEFRRQEKRGNP